MDSLDPFSGKNKSSQLSSQAPSLNQIYTQQKQTNQWNGNNTAQYSVHDFDIFLKPSPPAGFAAPAPAPVPAPVVNDNSFDPFFTSNFGTRTQQQPPPPLPLPTQSFDPFGPTTAPTTTTTTSSNHFQYQQPQQQQQQKQQFHSEFYQQDPFAPSTTVQQTSKPSITTTFDPFGPTPAPAPAPASSQPAQSSQFDVDFNFLNQSRPQVMQKQLSFANETIDLDWSIPAPSVPPKVPLSTSTSADVDDALQKLRSAYGLSHNSDLDDNTDGSNHENGYPNQNDWPMSPRPPVHPAPVIGKAPTGRYSHSGASHSPYPTEDRTVVTAEDLNLPTEGVILARLSVRSLVTKDWQPVFWIFSTDHHRRSLHFDEDPLSLLIYRSREDYEHNPLGTMIKKEIPIRMNLACIPIRRKEYKGFGLLHYFMLEEHTEMGSVPVIKFASSNRDDVDVLWINLKARINAAKRKAVKTLVDSRQV